MRKIMGKFGTLLSNDIARVATFEKAWFREASILRCKRKLCGGVE